MSLIEILLEFSGGLDVIFGGKREIAIQLPEKTNNKSGVNNTNWTIRQLLSWIQTNQLYNNDRADMLIQNGTVRPGVLVLVNQIDWEITGGLDATLENGDTVTFISTLHGG